MNQQPSGRKAHAVQRHGQQVVCIQISVQLLLIALHTGRQALLQRRLIQDQRVQRYAFARIQIDQRRAHLLAISAEANAA